MSPVTDRFAMSRRLDYLNELIRQARNAEADLEAEIARLRVRYSAQVGHYQTLIAERDSRETEDWRVDELIERVIPDQIATNTGTWGELLSLERQLIDVRLRLREYRAERRALPADGRAMLAVG